MYTDLAASWQYVSDNPFSQTAKHFGLQSAIF